MPPSYDGVASADLEAGGDGGALDAVSILEASAAFSRAERKHVHVLKFFGDVTASQVSQLRQEVTAALAASRADRGDEVSARPPPSGVVSWSGLRAPRGSCGAGGLDIELGRRHGDGLRARRGPADALPRRRGQADHLRRAGRRVRRVHDGVRGGPARRVPVRGARLHWRHHRAGGASFRHGRPPSRLALLARDVRGCGTGSPGTLSHTHTPRCAPSTAQPNVYERLKREGVAFSTITAGKFKRTLTPTKKIDPADEKKLKEDIEQILSLFKNFVASNRPVRTA